jgi:cell wall-associated NlpC family hydrolase
MNLTKGAATKLIMAAALLLTASACSVKRAAQSTKPSIGGTAGKPTTLTKPVEISDTDAKRLIAEARKWIGTPYSYGGSTRQGTDCSGFVMSVYRDVLGMKLPRSSAEQEQYSINIKRDELKPGDLVFFCTGGGSRVSHVGLYTGGGHMIHASTSRGVIDSALDERYYQRTYHSCGRVLSSDLPDTAAIKAAEVIDLDRAINSQMDSIYVSDPSIFN